MNNPNPFVPQGSLLEQQNKSRSRVKLAVFCVIAINVLGLMALLMEGCKREQPSEENPTPAVDTNVPPPVVDTNVPPMAAPTNPPAPPMPPVVTPTPPPEAPAPAAAYVVIKGDTLGKIAHKNGVSLKALEDANPGVQPTKLKVGQKLVIPAGGSAAPAATEASTGNGMTAVSGGGEMYTVKSGDTLHKIATAHRTTVKALQAENNLTTTTIKVGQKLKIPAAAAAAPAASAAPETPAPPSAPPAAAPAPAPAGNPSNP
jgi:LysM repeat protein